MGMLWLLLHQIWAVKMKYISKQPTMWCFKIFTMEKYWSFFHKKPLCWSKSQFYHIGDDFDHLIAHVLACSLRVKMWVSWVMEDWSLDHLMKWSLRMAWYALIIARECQRKGCSNAQAQWLGRAMQQIQSSSFWKLARPGRAEHNTQKREFSILFSVCSGLLGFVLRLPNIL